VKYFTIALIILNLGAAIGAVIAKQPYKVGYWLSAAMITYCAYKM
jgi:hypothetical protein